jgi:hypothetical protein
MEKVKSSEHIEETMNGKPKNHKKLEDRVIIFLATERAT